MEPQTQPDWQQEMARMVYAEIDRLNAVLIIRIKWHTRRMVGFALLASIVLLTVATIGPTHSAVVTPGWADKTPIPLLVQR